MATFNLGCPVCMCRGKAHLEASGGEWVGLIIPGYGSVRPNVCLNCGTVYVPKNVIDRISGGKKNGN